MLAENQTLTRPVADAAPRAVVSDDVLEILQRMTLIVGAVSKDGIVLAADTNAVEPAPNDDLVNDVADTQKIVCLDKHCVAYAFAGDRFSQRAGKELNELLERGRFFPDIESGLKMAGNIAMMPSSESAIPPHPIPRQLLVVLYGNQMEDSPQLWKLDITLSRSDATRVPGMTIVGARGNAARFFRTYYERYQPTDKMARLAAHIVLAGHKCDPSAVHGLDVITVAKGRRCHWLTESDKAKLRRSWQKLDAKMMGLYS